jgi:hypothetical protein
MRGRYAILYYEIPLAKTIYAWEDNIKMDVRGKCCENTN